MLWLFLCGLNVVSSMILNWQGKPVGAVNCTAMACFFLILGYEKLKEIRERW